MVHKKVLKHTISFNPPCAAPLLSSTLYTFLMVFIRCQNTTVSEGKYAYWAWPALVTHSFFALTVCMQGHYYYLVV